jgi:uncharacterized UBP type Zn finger protein
MSDQVCNHIREITEIKIAKEKFCEACTQVGGRWLHLRTCQTCGVTLCCDSSPHQHMTQHFHQTGHPVVVSAEPGEKWLWCYADESFVEYN